MDSLEDPIHCHKCKKKTKNIGAKIVQTTNGLFRIASQCSVCKTNKSKFIKSPITEPKEITKHNLTKQEQEIEANEIHKPVRKNFGRRRIITLGIDNLWAIDLLIMDKYYKENDDYKYILNVIDTFSKYVWAVPLKKKSGIHVSKAFENILIGVSKINHKPPDLIHSDKGLEFKNKEFSSLLNKYKIKLYHTENEEKSAIIERFNRTLNTKLKVLFEINKNFRWIDDLQKIIKNYNDTIHSTINMKPIEVDKSKEKFLLENVYNYEIPLKIFKHKFEIGDRVRIPAFKKSFENKYKNNWTREIFIISKISYTFPITYKLKDLNGEEITGSFYEYELQKTIL